MPVTEGASRRVERLKNPDNVPYDPIGNITFNSKIGTYLYPTPGDPQPHAVQGILNGSRTYQYDAAGRMTNRNGTVIQWNGDGKPSSVGNIGFTYDGVGNRLKKVSGGETTLYPFPDYEIADDGTTTKSLVGGKQVCDASGCEFFVYHRDHLGSIQSITDASGEVLHKAYEPFGDTHSTVGSHSDLRGWIGEREEETELVYLNARYYDPEIGRFVSPDPIAYLGQKLNRYTYSRNNPINYLDPSGLDDAYSAWWYESDGGGGGVFGDVWVNVTACADCPGPGVYVDPVVPDVGVGPLFPDPGGPGGGDPSGGPGEGGGDGTGGGSATGPASGDGQPTTNNDENVVETDDDAGDDVDEETPTDEEDPVTDITDGPAAGLVKDAGVGMMGFGATLFSISVAGKCAPLAIGSALMFLVGYDIVDGDADGTREALDKINESLRLLKSIDDSIEDKQ